MERAEFEGELQRRARRRGTRRAALLRPGQGLPDRQVPGRRAGRLTAGQGRVGVRGGAGRPGAGGAGGGRRAHDVPMPAVALRWLADQPTVVAPIASGRSVEQLADLLPMQDLALTDDAARSSPTRRLSGVAQCTTAYDARSGGRRGAVTRQGSGHGALPRRRPASCGGRASMVPARARRARARRDGGGRAWRFPTTPAPPRPIRSSDPHRIAAARRLFVEVPGPAAYDRLSALAARLLGVGPRQGHPVHRPGHRRRRLRAAAGRHRRPGAADRRALGDHRPPAASR